MWAIYSNVQAVSVKVSALCSRKNRDARTLSQWQYSHERCKIPSKPLSGLCVFPSPQSQTHRFKERKSRGVRLKFLLLRSLSFTHSHAHTHSCTDTDIQCPQCQPLASSRCLKTGSTSVLDSPFSPPPLATVVEERLAVKNESTACLSAPTSTPPRHKMSLIRMHLLWHHDPSLYPPLFSACNSKYL